MSAGDRVALVTGGNKGIGFETCRRLVEAGLQVNLAARNADLGRAAAERLGVSFVSLDVTSDESVSRAAQQVEDASGRLDVLINNAGLTGSVHDVRDITAADIGAVLSTSVVGYVRVIHAFLPLLERSTDPRIVNVSSGLGSFGLFHDPRRVESTIPAVMYAASKAAINMLTVRYAQQLPGIRVNAADPGMTATDLSGGQGHSVTEGTDAILAFALARRGGPSGTFRDRNGDLPW